MKAVASRRPSWTRPSRRRLERGLPRRDRPMRRLPISPNWTQVEEARRPRRSRRLFDGKLDARRGASAARGGDRRQVLSGRLASRSRRSAALRRRRALAALTLVGRAGELLAVLGAVRSGKSTLLRADRRARAADAGRVLIDGEDADRRAPPERGVSMVFQSFALFPHLTVRATSASGCEARRCRARRCAARVRETAAWLGSEELLERRPARALGRRAPARGAGARVGRRGRACCCSTSRSRTSTRSCAPSTRSEIKRLQRETGSRRSRHPRPGRGAVAGRSRRGPRDGRLEQDGTPDEVYERPATRWSRGFLGTPPMNLVPPSDGPARVPAPRTRSPAWTHEGDVVFELAERAGPDRLWHLRGGDARRSWCARAGAAPAAARGARGGRRSARRPSCGASTPTTARS